MLPKKPACLNFSFPHALFDGHEKYIWSLLDYVQYLSADLSEKIVDQILQEGAHFVDPHKRFHQMRFLSLQSTPVLPRAERARSGVER